MPLQRHTLLRLTMLLFALVLPCTTSVAQPHRKRPTRTSKPAPALKIDPANPTAMVDTLGSMSPAQFRVWLDSAQPAAISATDRDAAFTRAAWQAQIAIVQDPEASGRLQQQAAPVLKLFKRDQVVRFVVYLDNYPQIQTIAHTYIAVSTGLLQILKTPAQLNGLVAHELARQIKQDSFYSAWHNEDFQKLRQIELFCDAVAASALHAVNLPADDYSVIGWQVDCMPADDYSVILGRMINYTTVTKSANSSLATSRHPPLIDRQAVIRQIMKQSTQSPTPLALALL